MSRDTDNLAVNTSPSDSVVDEVFASLSDEEQEKQRDDWKEELKMTEDEILTLMQVIFAKEEQATQLKRKLGITAWAEMSEEIVLGLRQPQDCQRDNIQGGVRLLPELVI